MAQQLAPSLPGAEIAADRQCPHCGMWLSRILDHCPYCRQGLPELREVAAASKFSVGYRAEVRSGLLCMLLAAVIHYFAGGYSAMILPYFVAPIVTFYLTPLLFLSGLGLIVYSLLTRNRG